MAGQFYLSLLNPSLAFGFAGLAAILLRRWPTQIHLLPLGLAFFYLGIAFISQYWSLLSRPGTINYAANALFFAAVVLVCVSALIRAGQRVPVLLFGAVCLTAVLGFVWFAAVQPSMLSRIYFLNGCFAVLALATAALLKPSARTLPDKLFVASMFLGAILSGVRPLLLSVNMLQIDPHGDIAQSGYWASIQGVTPFLSIFVGSLFIFALVLDLMAGLRGEAEQDFLTGLLNRRGFETKAGERISAMKDAWDKPALLVADIDDFKQINDRFGHAVGDNVIAAVGRVLKQQGRTDVAGRIGGEEFALFYEASSRRMLENSASLLLAGLSNMHIEGLPTGHGLTLSIGLHIREGHETLADMMRRADRALYDAKAAGKNRAVLTPVRLRTV